MFIDSALGQFDNDPGLTSGYLGQCLALTAYAEGTFRNRPVLSVVAATNRAGKTNDFLRSQGVFSTDDTTTNTIQVYARWAQETAAATSGVAKAGTLVLLGIPHGATCGCRFVGCDQAKAGLATAIEHP